MGFDSDQGTHFTEVVQEVARMFKVKWNLNSPYSIRSIGMGNPDSQDEG